MVDEGEQAMIEFALAALADAYGNDIRKHVVKGAATNWAAQPLIGGGYSCALPGKAEARRCLAQTGDERLFFAGEAVSLDFYATAHGAHLTGIEAARRAASLLRS